MPLLGVLGALALAGLVASVADLAGNSATRGFTRFVFGVVALRAFGVTLSGLASWGGDVWALIPL
jgi:hypothetical protein